MPEPSDAVMNFPRRDARDKLRGYTRFTIDRARPGMLHAAMLRANTPSARIVRIDASEARKMPGVRAIVSAADAPGRHGIGIPDHPLFGDWLYPLRWRADRGGGRGDFGAGTRRGGGNYRGARAFASGHFDGRRPSAGRASSASRLAQLRSAPGRRRARAMWPGRRQSCAATSTPRSRAAMSRSSKASLGRTAKPRVL
jgi:CO/xanthine dehydrogenase Mo-binding subunit